MSFSVHVIQAHIVNTFEMCLSCIFAPHLKLPLAHCPFVRFHFGSMDIALALIIGSLTLDAPGCFTLVSYIFGIILWYLIWYLIWYPTYFIYLSYIGILAMWYWYLGLLTHCVVKPHCSFMVSRYPAAASLSYVKQFTSTFFASQFALSSNSVKHC